LSTRNEASRVAVVRKSYDSVVASKAQLGAGENDMPVTMRWLRGKRAPRKLRASMGVALGAALSVLAMAAPAAAAEHTMKIGLVTLNDMQHNYARRYKEVLEKATNNRIAVQIFPQSQLGTPASQIEGLRLGTIEMFMIVTDFFAGIDPRFGVFSIPYLFESKEAANRTLADPELNAAILSLAEAKGLVGVATAVQADARYFAKNPIRKLDDFKGMKLRVNATAAERERMRRLGATAVPMPLSEMIPALQTGVIDGTMSGISIYVNFNLHSVSKILTQTDDTLIISFGAISKRWLDTLPPDLRQIVVEEGRKLQPWFVQAGIDEDREQSQRWKERGGEIVNLPADETTKLRALLRDVGPEVTKADPAVKAFYERVIATAAKH
jgi:TRAP-type C4-dicarboxylate transport system substrate-binding protein